MGTLLNVGSSKLPDTDSISNLCYQFMDFFTNKTMKIRAAFDSSETNMSNRETLTQRVVEHPTTDVAAISEGEVQIIIKLGPTTDLAAKSTLPAHIPTMTHLINVSFESGTVHRELKKAVITPMLKKSGTVHRELKKAVITPMYKMPALSKNTLNKLQPSFKFTIRV